MSTQAEIEAAARETLWVIYRHARAEYGDPPNPDDMPDINSAADVWRDATEHDKGLATRCATAALAAAEKIRRADDRAELNRHYREGRYDGFLDGRDAAAEALQAVMAKPRTAHNSAAGVWAAYENLLNEAKQSIRALEPPK